MLKLLVSVPASADRVVELAESALGGDGLTIGRMTKAGVHLEHASVSRLHARLWLADSGLQVLDCGSTSGTCLNGARLLPQQAARLVEGDRLTFGSCTVTVQGAAAAASAAGGGEEFAATIAGAPPLESYMPVAAAGEDLADWKDGEIAVRVLRVIAETADVKTFVFAADPPVRFRYQPGQFIQIELSIDGKPTKRCYSISSSPTRPHLLSITVKRVPPSGEGVPPGLVSNWLHDHLKPGAKLRISGPMGDFSCVRHPGPRLLLISAGSGITPMLSMTRWLTDTAAAVDTVFLHTARTSADFVCRQELEWMAEQNPQLRLLLLTTRPEPGSRWPGLSVRLNLEVLRLGVPDFARRQIFCCGPDAFMADMRTMMEKAGFPMANYHEESFGAPRPRPAPAAADAHAATPPGGNWGLGAILKKIADQPGSGSSGSRTAATAPAAAVAATPAAATVEFRTSGRSAACPPGQSLLETAEGCGIAWPSGCRMGKCGACKAKLLAGELERSGYDDSILKPAERSAGFVLTCIGKPHGPVALGM